MSEDAIRRKLERYVLDGSEALQAIATVLNSPARPPDLIRAIRKILQRQYGDTVPVDAVIDLLNDGKCEPRERRNKVMS
jgi:hypothetical protein